MEILVVVLLGIAGASFLVAIGIGLKALIEPTQGRDRARHKIRAAPAPN
jgi:hypothetical protein